MTSYPPRNTIYACGGRVVIVETDKGFEWCAYRRPDYDEGLEATWKAAYEDGLARLREWHGREGTA